MTFADVTVDADDTILRSSELKPVIRRLRLLLVRVSSGEVVASPGFEQRLFGALDALEVVASGDPSTCARWLIAWPDADSRPGPSPRPPRVEVSSPGRGCPPSVGVSCASSRGLGRSAAAPHSGGSARRRRSCEPVPGHRCTSLGVMLWGDKHSGSCREPPQRAPLCAACGNLRHLPARQGPRFPVLGGWMSLEPLPQGAATAVRSDLGQILRDGSRVRVSSCSIQNKAAASMREAPRVT